MAKGMGRQGRAPAALRPSLGAPVPVRQALQRNLDCDLNDGAPHPPPSTRPPTGEQPPTPPRSSPCRHTQRPDSRGCAAVRIQRCMVARELQRPPAANMCLFAAPDAPPLETGLGLQAASPLVRNRERCRGRHGGEEGTEGPRPRRAGEEYG
jgi:hypothetical protein